jgi:tetratricopeptide (TPR) repeat protein
VNREERDYQAEVTRLQRLVATTGDPEEAARAQLLTAHAHQKAGRLELAEQSYRKVVARYARSRPAARAVARIAAIAVGRADFEGAKALLSQAGELVPALSQAERMNMIAGMEVRRDRLGEAEQLWWDVIEEAVESPEAADAIIGIVALYQRRGDQSGAIAACEKVVERGPDTRAGTTACELMTAISLPSLLPNTGATPGGKSASTTPPADHKAQIRRFSWIASDHPGTAAAAYATKVLAHLQLEEGLRLWKAGSYLAGAQSLETTLAQEVLDRRSTLTALHTIGMCYEAARQARKALPYLERAMELASDDRQLFDVGWLLGTCHYELGEYEDGYGLFKFIQTVEVPADLKETAQNMADDCQLQAEAAGRPVRP